MTNQWPSEQPQSPLALLAQWVQAQMNLETAKGVEINLRNLVVKTYFPDGKEGTENVELRNGYKLKAVFKNNYILDKNTDKVDGALVKLEKSSSDGKFVGERLISWEPKLSIAEWRKLSAMHREIIGEIVTIKPGQTSLEIVALK